MNNPLTNVLIKIFVRGFYRQHAGSLLFFFVGIFSYCFFIQVLNQTHLNPADRIIQNLLFVLTLLNSPPLVILVLLVWIGFTIKSYRYILGELEFPVNQFLFFSSTALERLKVFSSWLVVQSLISLPILIFAFFALVVGVIYRQYLTPFLILAFVLILNVSAAGFLTRRLFKIERFQYSVFSKIARHKRKPFYTLFLFHALDKLPLTLFITKAFSVGLIVGVSYLLSNINNNFTVAGLVGLSISIAHTFLLFESLRFEIESIPFVRNFPWTKSKIYLNWSATIGLLILPECIWLLLRFRLAGLVSVLFILGICLLLRNVLYKIQVNMKTFLYRVFWIFTLSFIGVLFNLLLVMTCLFLIASWVISSRFYYENEWIRIIKKS